MLAVALRSSIFGFSHSIMIATNVNYCNCPWLEYKPIPGVYAALIPTAVF